MKAAGKIKKPRIVVVSMEGLAGIPKEDWPNACEEEPSSSQGAGLEESSGPSSGSNGQGMCSGIQGISWDINNKAWQLRWRNGRGGQSKQSITY